MKFINLVNLSLLALSSVKASMYHASRITYYGGSSDGDSEKNPFCEDYSDRVPHDVGDIDYYVALSSEVLSKSNAREFCGKKIRLSNAENGRSLTALVVDKCGSCDYGDVDLSRKAFKYISNDQMSKGVLKKVSWCIEGGPSKFACSSSDSSSSSNKKTTKKTTKTTKTTKKSSTRTTKKSSTKTKTTKTKTTKTTKKSTYTTSSSSSRSAGGVYIELEKGTRYGDVSKATSIKYYSGSAYVYIDDAESSSGSRSRVAAKVNLSKSGKYDIVVKYNNSSSKCRENRIIINDSNVYRINFGKTGSDWKKLTIKGVPFKSGQNIIEVRATDGKMSFDYIYIL